MTDPEIIAALTPLAPLKRPLYSVHFVNSGNLLAPERKPLLEQTVRICRGFPISVEWPSRVQADLALELCPKYSADLVLSSSPWQLMAANGERADNWGANFVKDLTALISNLGTIKTLLQGKLAPKVIGIDIELWKTSTDSPSAMDAKLSIVNNVIKNAFPDILIELYDRGAVSPDNDKGWSQGQYSTLKEDGDYFCCSMYYPAEPTLCLETFRRTQAAAAKVGITKVIPWIALGGSGGRKKFTIYSWITPDMAAKLGILASNQIDYSTENSYLLGFALNDPWASGFPDRFVDATNVPHTWAWPPVFNKDYPNSAKHFIAYCQGANRI